MALGVAIPPPAPDARRASMPHDADLYRLVAARVANGEGYYAAAAREHRALGYPLRPFVTVRPPLLAEATAVMGRFAAAERVLRVALLVTLVALLVRLAGVDGGGRRLAGWLLAIGSVGILVQPGVVVWHEAWAAMLVTLALAVHRPGRWWPSVALAVLGAMTRELAIPFLLVMGAAALVERRRGEAIGWAVAIAIVGVALAFHAASVAGVALPGDRASQGWAGGGWAGVVAMLSSTSILTLVPHAVAAALIPLALLGWAGLSAPFGLRAALWTIGMAAAFTLGGRTDNFYWGLMLAPLLPIGLAFAPRALRDLGRSAAGLAAAP